MEARNVRIFVASPGDVAEEREILAGVVNDLNNTFNVLNPGRRVLIDFIRWETHARPAAGRPQALITKQIGEYDIFVGIMWRRFGSPTGVAESGTEEEFSVAYRRWKTKHAPHIMFYFSSAPAPPPQTVEEARQLLRVVRFRTGISGKVLAWPYDGPGKFADVVRRHLTAAIAEMLPSSGAAAPPAAKKRERAATQRKRSRQPVRITKISRDDAFYSSRKRLIGRPARLQNVRPTGDGWYGGLIELADAHEGEMAVVPLFRFKWEP